MGERRGAGRAGREMRAEKKGFDERRRDEKKIRWIRPFLTREAAQLLVQALVISHLDSCNSLQAGLPACAIKPLQHIQNAAARLVFNQPHLDST